MIFRVVFISITAFLAALAFTSADLLLTPWILLILLMAQIAAIPYEEKKIRDRIISFAESLISDEIPSNKPLKNGSIYCRLRETMSELIEKHEKSYRESWEKQEMAEAMLDHLSIGLLSFNRSGSIEEMNKAARLLLNEEHLRNIRDSNHLSKDSIDKLLDFNTEINGVLHIQNNSSVYLKSSALLLREQPVRIISIQNLNKTLNEKEQDSWNILIRTLNHEIMNSITPICSLASSALSIGCAEKGSDLFDALETIERRSRNLLRFVENYKALSQLPRPKKELIRVSALFDETVKLTGSFAGLSGAVIIPQCDDRELLISADRAQIEQILLNLIKNSIEARATSIDLKAVMNDESYVEISLIDNGRGFSVESLQKAFIPFYTTKDQGSGLGLSIVRQIMHSHGGEASLESIKGSTCVFLRFP